MTCPMKLLIVDDDENVLRILGEFLKASPYKLIVARSAKEAFNLSQEADVILTDYRMPGMDGMELVVALREQGNYVPVIIMTGMIFDKAPEALAQYKIVDVLQKPLNMVELTRKIEHAIKTAENIKFLDEGKERIRSFTDSVRNGKSHD